jgi:hypothetical protein
MTYILELNFSECEIERRKSHSPGGPDKKAAASYTTQLRSCRFIHNLNSPHLSFSQLYFCVCVSIS